LLSKIFETNEDDFVDDDGTPENNKAPNKLVKLEEIKTSMITPEM